MLNFEKNNYMVKELYLYSPFYSETAEQAVRDLNAVGEDEELTIRINTPGGGVSDGWAIISKLSERKKEKNGIVDGVAMSMGGILLMFLDNVIVNDTSRIMLHKAAYANWYEPSDQERATLKVINDKFKEKLSKKVAGKKGGKELIEKVFEPDVRNDVELTPEEALSLGIANEIRQLEPTAYHGKQIVAMSEENSNINTNKKVMGKLADLIFGEKDPVLLASIGETQFVYSKLEKGAKVKATGKDDKDPVSGTFEADNKKVTVVNNEITEVEGIDNKQVEIEALKAEIKELKATQLTAEDVAAVIIQLKEGQDKELKAIKATLEKAKLSVSNPELPEGEFENKPDPVAETPKKKERNIQKNADARAQAIAEAVRKQQNERRL